MENQSFAKLLYKVVSGSPVLVLFSVFLNLFLHTLF